MLYGYFEYLIFIFKTDPMDLLNRLVKIIEEGIVTDYGKSKKAGNDPVGFEQEQRMKEFIAMDPEERRKLLRKFLLSAFVLMLGVIILFSLL